ncbi:MAG: hypothetical protein CME63_14395 [Halobacteriovoraceae bacterium]|nr:hypothetical protein [Halobacteriovoraceae bacterium]
MNMLKKCLTLLSLIFILSVSNPQAADQSSGCGLGWMVFKDNSLISSALRATTNAMFFNTIGMTFGTSGCARHSIVMNDKKTLHFTEANHNELKLEVAQGSGEHLNGLSHLMGCSPEVFSSTLQKNYNRVFTKENISPRELVNNIQAQVVSEENLARGCGIAII